MAPAEGRDNQADQQIDKYRYWKHRTETQWHQGFGFDGGDTQMWRKS